MSRARAFADKHGIARVHESYEALIADPDLDAVYNLLPTSVHGRWTRATLDAGKHVLCEKPFTANAAEAREIAELAAKSDRVVMEALQYRFHPLTARVEQIIASGEFGKLERVEMAVWCTAEALQRQRLRLLPRRGRADGCRRLYGRHGPDVRRFDSRSRFGKGETGRSSGGSGHDGRVAVCKRAARAGSTALCGRRICFGRAPRWLVIAASCVTSVRPHLTLCLGFRSDQPTESVWSASAAHHLRVSARRFRRGGAARGSGEDDAARRDREHDRHRRDLSRCGPPAPPAVLNVHPFAWWRIG